MMEGTGHSLDVLPSLLEQARNFFKTSPIFLRDQQAIMAPLPTIVEGTGHSLDVLLLLLEQAR
eukprot:12412557-Karenia_brevis.AAC.1